MTAHAGAGRFGTVLTAMVTPFDPEGALDVDGAVRLARWLADNGSDGLVVAGTTGEGSALDDGEATELWRAVSAAVTVPVVAATGSNDTRHTVERTKAAEAAGADAVLVVTPYYVRPSQAGMAAHFQRVAEATSLPVLLYDIPVRTGRKIATGTMLQLARNVANIVGVKDSAGDVVATARLVAGAPDGFEVYCGDDVFMLPMLAVGAVGLVSVSAHWLGPQLSEMIATFAKGDTRGAQVLNARLLDSASFQSSEEYPNPMPAKAVCRALGLPAGQCRLPIGPAPAELDELAARIAAQSAVAQSRAAQSPVAQSPVAPSAAAGVAGS
ncbi:MAG: 4-hydroxy-tetrahydrodipicolinate synthase [Acidimicrobiales bacterium]